MDGQINLSIDYDKFEEDEKWDGLKAYVTNTALSRKEVIAAYGNLWHIEKAFRISKFDLRVRPIYHQVQRRIEAHICICFSAYAVHKELERILKINNVPFSTARAIELCKTMYQIKIVLPDTMVEEKILLKMTEEQQILLKVVS
jgi:transposase